MKSRQKNGRESRSRETEVGEKIAATIEDLKFKISEGYDQNWCFPDFAQLAVSAKLRQLTG